MIHMFNAKIKARSEVKRLERNLSKAGNSVSCDVMVFRDYIIFGAVCENTKDESKFLKIFKRSTNDCKQLSKDEFLKEINKTLYTEFSNVMNYCLYYKPIYVRTGQVKKNASNNEVRQLGQVSFVTVR